MLLGSIFKATRNTLESVFSQRSEFKKIDDRDITQANIADRSGGLEAHHIAMNIINGVRGDRFE